MRSQHGTNNLVGGRDLRDYRRLPFGWMCAIDQGSLLRTPSVLSEFKLPENSARKALGTSPRTATRTEARSAGHSRCTTVTPHSCSRRGTEEVCASKTFPIRAPRVRSLRSCQSRRRDSEHPRHGSTGLWQDRHRPGRLSGRDVVVLDPLRRPDLGRGCSQRRLHPPAPTWNAARARDALHQIRGKLELG